MSETATLSPAAAAREKDLFDRVMKDPRELPKELGVEPGPGRTVERAIVFHRRASEQMDDKYLRKFLDVLAHDHGFHLDILGHLLADIRDREMHLTPGRKLAPVDVPWVAAIFEGVVPPWRRDQESETTPTRWFINYM